EYYCLLHYSGAQLVF
nr:immunoglobulin light chain junction region [Macaca mulatta]MOX81495.1 immunoglobulin light chain junction region [Macaca mulatta]MOX84389.1 immunoglobulin light chain junction region [Macaca mulatta]